MNFPSEGPKDSRLRTAWRRYIHNPLVAQLKQGVTPEQLAKSMAWGAVIGVFPILGTTTTLCGIAAVSLRLNHIAIQVVNWLVYPAQVLLIIPYLNLGNAMFGLPAVSLSLAEIAGAFEADFRAAVLDMGWLAARGILAWTVCALPLVYVMNLVFRLAVRKLRATMRSAPGEVRS